MPAPVSVLIPTLNAEHQIGPLLAALVEGVAEGLIAEVILADGGSDDGTAALADACGARVIVAPPGRGTQLGHAAGQARGAWLLILHADTVPDAGWVRAIEDHMASCPDKAGWFGLSFDLRGVAPWLVAGWANLRARLFGLPFGDQGMLISRVLYTRVGGYPPIPLMEDVALARALGRRNLRPLNHKVTTSAARYARDGWLRRGARNLGLQVRYHLGQDPARLARAYRR